MQDTCCYHLRLLQYDNIDAQTGTRAHKTTACSKTFCSAGRSSPRKRTTHGAKLLFPITPPHSLAISNGRRWAFDGPVQRTGARAGSVQRSRETHSAANARGSTGLSSVVGRTSVLDPALWEDGVLRELPAGAPASDSRQSATRPSGPSSGRSGFGARLIDMNGDGTPLLSAQHAVALSTCTQGPCAGACEASAVSE